MNSASKDEVVEEVKKLADENAALRRYCDQLLATVIDRIPEILEIPKRRPPSKQAAAAKVMSLAPAFASADTSGAPGAPPNGHSTATSEAPHTALSPGKRKKSVTGAKQP